jgi:hypothetical protein
MEASRGRKGKKGRWQLSLGLKEAIFAGLGLTGLMMMAFALGALAGRGDIYRVFYQWGLLNPEAAKVAQWLPQGVAPSAPLVATTGPAASTATRGLPAAPPAEMASPPAPPAPVTGSLAPVPPATAPQKKSKGSSLKQEQKAKEEELRKVRQEVVSKLKFQNSLDTPAKPPRVSQKQKQKEKAAASKPQPSQVRVAQFRDSKAAQAKMAELEKKGIKATLKQEKDAQGPLYTVYKQVPPGPSQAEKLAQKPQKTGEKTTRPRAEPANP